jgi:hypothetical protein
MVGRYIPKKMDLKDGLVGRLRFKKLFGSAQVAQPIGNSSGVEDPDTRFLVQAGMAF